MTTSGRTVACAAALIALTAAPDRASAGGPAGEWVRQSPFPTWKNLRAVSFPTPDHGFFIANETSFDAEVWETDDAGAAWALRADVNPNFDNGFSDFSVRDVFFADAANGWISGNSSPLFGEYQNYRTTDGGATWTVMDDLLAGSWGPLKFLSPLVGWAGSNGGVSFTADGGVSWSVPDPDAGNVWTMDFVSENAGVTSGNLPEGTKRTEDGGGTWSLVSNQVANGLVMLDEQVVVAAAPDSLQRSTDGGATWTEVLPGGESLGFLHVARIDDTGVAAFTFTGDIYRSTDEGLTWTQTFVGPRFPHFDAHFPTASLGYAVGNEGIVVGTTDGGASWSYLSNGVGTDLRDIGMFDDERGLAVGALGVVISTGNGGETWIPDRPEAAGDLRGLDIVSDSFAVAVGFVGSAVKTDDGGETWSSMSNQILQQFDFYEPSFLDEQEGWIAGTPAVIYHTTDGGNTWQNQFFSGGFPLTSIDFLDSQRGWAAGPADIILRTDDGGATWSFADIFDPAGGPDAKWAIRFVSDDRGWLAGNFGYIARSDDGGLTWQVQTLGEFDHVVALHPVDENEVWAATFNGTVLHTTDGGDTWQLVPTGFEGEELLGFDGITRSPEGSVWVAGPYGTVLKMTATASCPWDCGDGDGQVGTTDFLALLAGWGAPGACDADGDGTVGTTDFLALLANWGPCP